MKAKELSADVVVSVIVVEKKQEIGPPKRCAEGLAIDYFESIGIEPRPDWAVNRIEGAYVYSPSDKKIHVTTGDFGFILERKIFEKHLATESIKAGAKYILKTRATSVIKEDGAVTGIVAEGLDGEMRISSRIVIAADGVDSKIGRSAGLKTHNEIRDYHSGFQYEMAGIKNLEEDHLHVFFGGGQAPGGYIWIFPKGNTTANVGVGIVSTESRDGSRAKDYLDSFIEKHPEMFREASYLEINSGGIPVCGSMEKMVLDGFMVVGDAAHQVNPIHGGGIGLAMEAGQIAAEVAAQAVEEGDVSEKRLKAYEEEWRKKRGKKLKRLLKLRYLIEKLGAEELDKLADILDSETIMEMTKGNFLSFMKILLTKSPRLLPLAKKFLK